MENEDLLFQIIYQSIGIIAMIISCISFQFKSNKTFLLLQCCSCLLFSIQFLIGKAVIGCIMNAICVLRSIFYYYIKDKKHSIIGTVIFSIMFILAGIFGVILFKNPWYIALVCALASIVSSFALCSKNNDLIRISQVSFVSPIWLFNNIFYLTIGGIIAESLNFFSALIALIKDKFNK